MKIDIGPGTYVVAVSGGVDSVVLLCLLVEKSKTEGKIRLIIAHLDHGIRTDSRDDRLFVEKLAKSYSLPFVFDEGNLGAKASEAKAREIRYRFLKKVKKASGAQAIITAHHQDDVIETAIINILRGTARRGLSSIRNTNDLIRPLISYSKNQILAYAGEHDLQWREDVSNQDVKYLRNYVRHNILPKFSIKQKDQLLEHINSVGKLNQEIDDDLGAILKVNIEPELVNRDWLIMLPRQVALEVLVSWLKDHQVADIDKKGLEKLLVAAKTLRAGKKFDIDKRHFIEVKMDNLALRVRER